MFRGGESGDAEIKDGFSLHVLCTHWMINNLYQVNTLFKSHPRAICKLSANIVNNQTFALLPCYKEMQKSY